MKGISTSAVVISAALSVGCSMSKYRTDSDVSFDTTIGVSSQSEILILEADYPDDNYKSLGWISGEVKKRTAFNKDPTKEQANIVLSEKAKALGADAVINVTYESGVGVTTWGYIRGSGEAIKMGVSREIPSSHKVPTLRQVEQSSRQEIPALRQVEQPLSQEIPTLRQVEQSSGQEIPALRQVEQPLGQEIPALKQVEQSPSQKIPALKKVEQSPSQKVPPLKQVEQSNQVAVKPNYIVAPRLSRLREVDERDKDDCGLITTVKRNVGGHGDVSTFVKSAKNSALTEVANTGADSYFIVNVESTLYGASVTLDALRCE